MNPELSPELRALITNANSSPYISVGARVAARNIADIEHLGVDEAVLIVGRLYQRAMVRKVADIGGTAEALRGVAQDNPGSEVA